MPFIRFLNHLFIAALRFSVLFSLESRIISIFFCFLKNIGILYMLNGILHKFDLHLVSLEEMIKHKQKLSCAKEKLSERKKQIKKARGKYFSAKVRNKLLEDMASGMKREKLIEIYGSALRVQKYIDEYTVPRNIFCC